MERLAVAAWTHGLRPAEIQHLAYSNPQNVLLIIDIHKPGQPQYLVVITGQVIDYVEAKYKCTAEEYRSLAAQRRMVCRGERS
jgi:hypothetical protein